MTELEALVRTLRSSSALSDKLSIRAAYAPALAASHDVPLGDDCAAIRTADGYLLFAAEGMLDDFVEADPWFAGYSAVMVNLSDIAAMGGTPVALTDVLWTPDHAASEEVWRGLRAAAEAYGVPIVGGHTTVNPFEARVRLAVAAVGRATQLLTSFDAAPGDRLMVAVDLNGAYRGDQPFWNASTCSDPRRLRRLNALLPELAESGRCAAAKDISNGGIIGTLVMLLQTSEAGASLDLSRLPRPSGVDLGRWLVSFPSFGFVLAVAPDNVDAVEAHFRSEGVACDAVGSVDTSGALSLSLWGERALFWQQTERVGARA